MREPSWRCRPWENAPGRNGHRICDKPDTWWVGWPEPLAYAQGRTRASRRSGACCERPNGVGASEIRPRIDEPAPPASSPGSRQAHGVLGVAPHGRYRSPGGRRYWPARPARRTASRELYPLSARHHVLEDTVAQKLDQPLLLLPRWGTALGGGPISVFRFYLAAAELADPRRSSPAGLTLIPERWHNTQSRLMVRRPQFIPTNSDIR